MIWTLTIIGSLATLILVGGLLAHRAFTKRRRSVNWNDLHERGKLITSQLAHLREVNARRIGPGSVESPREIVPGQSPIDPAETTPSPHSS